MDLGLLQFLKPHNSQDFQHINRHTQIAKFISRFNEYGERPWYNPKWVLYQLFFFCSQQTENYTCSFVSKESLWRPRKYDKLVEKESKRTKEKSEEEGGKSKEKEKELRETFEEERVKRKRKA